MAADENQWSSYQLAYHTYPAPEYTSTRYQSIVGNATTSYQTPAYMHAYYPPPLYPFDGQYTPIYSTYGGIVPTVNPFSGYDTCGQFPDIPDAEVSNYSGMTRLEHFYEDARCSSTDTTVSSSSVSTVVSHGSVDTDTDSTQAFGKNGRILKRKKGQSENSTRVKKVKNGSVPYKRWPKPPYSYCGMIATVIENSPRRELTLQGIHASLMEYFPFFRGSYVGWKDSVRHNLSHSPCFVKRDDELSVKCKIWHVDLSKLTPSMFSRQVSRVSQCEEYHGTIHEHLGLAPIHTCVKMGIDSPCESADNPDAPKCDTSPITPVPWWKIPHGEPLTPSDTSRFSVTLPSVDICDHHTPSPYKFNTRDFTPGHFVHPSSADTTPVKLSDSTEMSPLVTSSSFMHNWSLNSSHISQVRDLIVSEKRTSLDAVQHLRILCSPVPTMYHAPEPEAHLFPLSGGSDIMPIPPVNKPTAPIEMCGTLRSKDFSISELINPVSPSETFVTSLEGRSTESHTFASRDYRVSESGSDRATPGHLISVDDEDDSDFTDL